MSKSRILSLIFTFALSMVLLSACKKDKDAEPATPTITNLSANTACIGNVITITGTNFSTVVANNIVKFGTTTATVETATATQLTVLVPAQTGVEGGGAGSTYSITVTNNGKTSAGIDFTYQAKCKVEASPAP